LINIKKQWFNTVQVLLNKIDLLISRTKRNLFKYKQVIVNNMRKFILLIFIVLSCVSQPSGKNWYVSTTSSGNASGDSWANKRILSSFNWGQVLPGDTVFIDGGPDGLTYSYGIRVENKNSGTNKNRIVVTRGKENGHNGRAFFNTSSQSALYVAETDFWEFSYLDFKVSTDAYHVTVVTGCNGIDIVNCNIENPWGTAFFISASNTRLLHNTSNTGKVTNNYKGGLNSTDAVFLHGGNGVNHTVEIAYNKFILQNTDLIGHKDIIQSSWNWGSQGVTKIHDNFFLNKPDSGNSLTAGIYLAEAQGYYEIYNNIIAVGGSNGSLLGIYKQNWSQINNTLKVYAKVLNNTIVALQSDDKIQAPKFYGIDSLEFKNNLIFRNNGSNGIFISGYTENGYLDINNNQYFIKDPNNFAYLNEGIAGTKSINFMEWQTIFGDKNGKIGKFNIQNVGGIQALDYQLVEGSSGIDEGISLKLFETDFVGTNRPQGKGWDIGAFEFKVKDTGSSTDNSAPTLLGAAGVNSTTIELSFSEELELLSAQLKTNYTINNGITVNSASLSSDKKKVTLTTSQHTNNQSYTVTVTAVKDLAGNAISSNNSAQYTFVDNTVGDLKVNIKVFLQGAFQNGNMMTSLKENNLLPATQPYNRSPWNYNGSEVISSSSSSSLSAIVDWVLVELRSSQNPALVIARRAALLRNDGFIVDTDGNTTVTFKSVVYGSYYLAIRHRNHLSVMSAVAVELAPNGSLYDFTKSIASAYGQNPMAEISTGLFGMYSGDGDANGNINDVDRNDIWSVQNGNMGYLSGDYNLDSGVTIKDTNNYWNLNQGKVAQVP
jgi:hypothetical protein